MPIQDSTHTISTSIKRFFSGTMISRFTGLAREVAMAAAFGTLPAVAAFWMAFRFAHLLRRLFGEGALHAVFVPHFESLRKQDPLLGARFFYDLSMGLTLLLLSLIFLVEVILGGVLLFGNPSAANREVISLTMILLPALVFISLYALNTSLLNCEYSYFLPSVAPSFLNLVWLLAIFFVWKKPVSQAIEVLAMIIVFAFALQWMVTLPKVYRFLSKELGDKWRENYFSGKEILRIVRPFALGMIGVAATQVNSALDALFARSADPQGPAFLWYALRIQQLPLALFGVGLTGALLPPISRAIQKGEHTQYLQFLNFSLRKTILLLVPITVALFVLGFSGINLVYGHGEFSQNAILQTTRCLWAYGLALMPMTLVLIFASAFFAQKNYRIPAFLAVCTVILNIGFNALFVFVFRWGAMSIALATALAACINGGFLAYFLKRKTGFDLEGLGGYFIKVILCSTIAAMITLLLGHFTLQENTLAWVFGKELNPFPRGLMRQLFVFGSQSLYFCTLFFAGAFLLRIKFFGGLKIRKRQEY